MQSTQIEISRRDVAGEADRREEPYEVEVSWTRLFSMAPGDVDAPVALIVVNDFTDRAPLAASPIALLASPRGDNRD